MIATFFRDYCYLPTIHLVTTLTIFTHGIGLEVCKCEEELGKMTCLEFILHQRLSHL